MRINVDEKFFTDPKVELFAELLKMSRFELAGRLLYVWLECYRRRSPIMTQKEVDLHARYPGFSNRGLDAGLFTVAGEGLIRVSGVEERVANLEIHRKLSIKGGKSSVLGAKRDEKGHFVSRSVQPETQPTVGENPTEEPRVSKDHSHTHTHSNSICRLPDVQNLWNSNRGQLPEVKKVQGRRLTAWRARWKEKPNEDFWRLAIQKLATNPYSTGQNDTGWVATIDYLVKPDTWVKILEGKYDLKQAVGGGSHAGSGSQLR